MGDARGHFAHRRKFLFVLELGIGGFQLHQAFAQRQRHPVEGPGQVAGDIRVLDGHPVFQVAAGDALDTLLQPEERTDDGLGQQIAQDARQQDGDDDERNGGFLDHLDFLEVIGNRQRHPHRPVLVGIAGIGGEILLAAEGGAAEADVSAGEFGEARPQGVQPVRFARRTGQQGMGYDMTGTVFEDVGDAVVADIDALQEFGKGDQIDIDAADAAEIFIFRKDGGGDGNTRFLRRGEEIDVGPVDAVAGHGAFVPGAVTGIEDLVHLRALRRHHEKFAALVAEVDIDEFRMVLLE